MYEVRSNDTQPKPAAPAVRSHLMREYCVIFKGVAMPLALCATAVARMPCAGMGRWSAFVHHRTQATDMMPNRGMASGGRSHALLTAFRMRNPSAARRASHRTTTSMRADHRTEAEAVELSEEKMAHARRELYASVKAAVADMPHRPKCAVIGGGFAGLATAYHLAAFDSDVTVFDPDEVGTAGASSVAAGLLHPLTPRGKRIWKGEEGLSDAKELIKVANAALAASSATEEAKRRGCITTDKVYRPLMDDKNYEAFSKAAEDLPQWVTRLTAEEYLEAVPGADSNCLGGVRIKGALAVDAQEYLRGLWAACCSTSEAKWVHQRVDDVHALASSGEFHAVVACVGSGVKTLPGVKDIVSLRLVRGQSLIYDNVGDPRKKSDLEGGVTSDRRGEDGGSIEPGEEGREGKMLTSAVLCGQYVVPTGANGAGNGGKLVFGATQEPILYADSLNKPADMATAKRYLEPKIAKFFPALQGFEPLAVTTGIRVIQDRNSYGRIPIAGRLPFSERGWVLAALGARGLIHHAYLGRLLAACALLDSDEYLPPQVLAPLEDLGKDSTGDL